MFGVDRLIAGTSGSQGSPAGPALRGEPGPRGLEPEDLTPQMREESTDLYRR